MATLAALLLTLAPATLPGGTTWIVDAGGAGDFTDIQAAIDAAQDGDVLLVNAGTYPAIDLGKSLTILGVSSDPHRVRIAGHSRVVGATDVTLSNLRFNQIWAKDLPGRLVLDGCRVSGSEPIGLEQTEYYALRTKNCAAVIVEDSYLYSGWGCCGESTFAALRAIDSTVWIRGSTLRGWSWGDPFAPSWAWLYEGGGTGLLAIHSAVFVEATYFVGGHATTACQIACYHGEGGDGIRAVDGSTVVVRSKPDNSILGGGGAGSNDGHAVLASDGSVVWLSSGTLDSSQAGDAHTAVDGTSQILQVEDAPTLRRFGDGLADGTYRVAVHAPADAIGVLFLAPPAAPYGVPGWHGSAFLGSPLLLWDVVVGDGLADPVFATLDLPPSIPTDGLGELWFAQAFFPFEPGLVDPATADASGPIPLLLNF